MDGVDPDGERGNGCGVNRTLSVMKRVSRDQHQYPVINIKFAFTNVNINIVTRPSTTVITSNTITFSIISISIRL
jgi:hypothetical protein